MFVLVLFLFANTRAATAVLHRVIISAEARFALCEPEARVRFPEGGLRVGVAGGKMLGYTWYMCEIRPKTTSKYVKTGRKKGGPNCLFVFLLQRKFNPHVVFRQRQRRPHNLTCGKLQTYIPSRRNVRFSSSQFRRNVCASERARTAAPLILRFFCDAGLGGRHDRLVGRLI